MVVTLARRDVHEQDCKLVAARVGGDIGTHRRSTLEALADFGEQSVASVVAERVVDQLEVVEVEERHCVGAPTVAFAGDRSTQLFEEHPPVW